MTALSRRRSASKALSYVADSGKLIPGVALSDLKLFFEGCSNSSFRTSFPLRFPLFDASSSTVPCFSALRVIAAGDRRFSTQQAFSNCG